MYSSIRSHRALLRSRRNRRANSTLRLLTDRHTAASSPEKPHASRNNADSRQQAGGPDVFLEAISEIAGARSRVDLGVRTLRAIEETIALAEDSDFLWSFAPNRQPARRGRPVALVGVLDGNTLEICSSIPPHRAALTLETPDEQTIREALIETYCLAMCRRSTRQSPRRSPDPAPDYDADADSVTCRLGLEGELQGMILLAHPGDKDKDWQPSLEALATVCSTVLARLDAAEQLDEAKASASELVTCLVHSSEEERALLAGDLHDGPLQGLTAVSYYLQMAREEATTESLEGPKGVIEKAEKILREEIRKMRNLVSNLLPPPVEEEADFVSCLERGVERILEEFPEAPIEFVAPPDQVALPPEQASLLFRCVQEALRNAAKHARASKIRLLVDKRDDCLVITVEDDGVGFDVEKTRDAVSRGHIGLAYMKKRVEILGGAMLISSSPGRGTRIEVAVFIPST